jgi:predicted membrane-bound dolichyl-phosphate-mannose-protein mannosyltransferase
MKRFLTLTAVIEAATGLALIAVPAIVVRLLLGAEISGASIPLGRVAGAALLALGVACWLARDDTQSRAARGLVVAMLIYNIVATAVLAFAGIGWGCTASCCGLRWFSTRRWPSGASRLC